MPDNVMRKAFAADMETEGRTFTATITSDSVDREGEVLLPAGMDATDFESNPVVFWNHDYNVPIGKAVELKRGKRRWVGKAKLADRPADHPGEWLPDTIHALMKQGVVKGVSVGFIPTESRHPSAKDKELFGDGVKRVFSKWKLLEFSVTPLPANQTALITAVSKGILTRDKAKTLFGVEVPQAPAPPKRRKVYVFLSDDRPRINVRNVATEAAAVAIARRYGKMSLT